MAFVHNVNNITQNNRDNVKIDKQTTNAKIPEFSNYFDKEKSLDDIFQQAADRYDVPVNLLKAIGKAESNFKPNAVSRSGAQGVMQLMPATAKSLGVTDSFDPEQNIMGGSKYIADLLKKYDGDTKLALAAYNAGMGNVKKYGGVPPFKETQNYVVKVMNFMKENISTGKTVETKSSMVLSSANQAYINSYDLQNSKEMNEFNDIFNQVDYLKFIEKFRKDDNSKDVFSKPYSSNPMSYGISIQNIWNK